MDGKTCCTICRQPIPVYEEKHYVEMPHVDIPISHFPCCASCAQKVVEQKHENISMSCSTKNE